MMLTEMKFRLLFFYYLRSKEGLCCDAYRNRLRKNLLNYLEIFEYKIKNYLQ